MRDLKEIKYIIIHCSDSDLKEHDNIETIDKWHKLKGWRKVGYNYFITKSGDVEIGRLLKEIPAHCKDHNRESIGICLSGRKNFTTEQIEKLVLLVSNLLSLLDLPIDSVLPHNFFNKLKTCPNIDVYKLRKRLAMEAL